MDAVARLTAANDPFQQEAQLLREGLGVRSIRLADLDPRRRTYYLAAKRMAILELKGFAGRGGRGEDWDGLPANAPNASKLGRKPFRAGPAPIAGMRPLVGSRDEAWPPPAPW